MATPNSDIERVLRFLACEAPTVFDTSIVVSADKINRIYQYITPINTVRNSSITLPSAPDVSGGRITIVNIGVAGSELTVLPVNGEKIYGGLLFSDDDRVLQASSAIELFSDGSNWIVSACSSTDAIVVSGYRNGTDYSSWYRKLQSGLVLMGGTNNIPANQTTRIVTLPLALKAGDWPVTTFGVQFDAPNAPVISLSNVSSTSFTAVSASRNYNLGFTWHAYGYWK